MQGLHMSETEPRAFEKGVGQRIKKARKDLKMPQKALAADAGYASHTMISEIEQGLQMPSPEKLVAIARVLGVSVDWILGVESTPSAGSDPDDLSHKEAILHCTSAQLRAVADVIDDLCPLHS